MRSERINRLYGKYWEVRGREKWADGDSRLKEKSFLPFSQGQLSRSAWTALERTWAEACWSKIWGLARSPPRGQVDGHFLFPSHNQLVSMIQWNRTALCNAVDFWTSVICGSWIWGRGLRAWMSLGPGCRCSLPVLDPWCLSSQLFCLNPLIATCSACHALNSHRLWDLAHTSQSHTCPWEGISFRFSL